MYRRIKLYLEQDFCHGMNRQIIPCLPNFLMHSSYCSFFNTCFHSVKGVRPTILTLDTKCTNLDVTCTLWTLPCMTIKKSMKIWGIVAMSKTNNYIEGTINCIHTLTPSIMDRRAPRLFLFTSSTQLVTWTCLDLFFAWTSLMYGYQAWSLWFHPIHGTSSPWGDAKRVWIVKTLQTLQSLFSNDHPNYLSSPRWHQQHIHQYLQMKHKIL